MIKGIDVSHFQGSVDWQKVSNDGIGFAICKATQGTGFEDPTFRLNIMGAKKNGLITGAYHFFDPNKDAVLQGQAFIDQIALLDYPLIVGLDLEQYDGWDDLSAEQISENVQEWCDYVQARVNGKPIIYTNAPFADQYLTAFPMGNYRLWLAHYLPAVPSGYQNYAIWQYSQSGTVNGISNNVDLDRFDGSLVELQQLAVVGKNT